MNVAELVFLLLSGVAIASGLLCVTADRVVHAALWLVVVLGALAGCYLLLGAELVAWVQVLIYVGSVVVLVIFALMLTRSPTGPGAAAVTANRWPAAALGVLSTLALGAVLMSGFRGERLDDVRIGTARSIGDALFSDWVLGFEVLSVVLLAALVGAIVLTKADDD